MTNTVGFVETTRSLAHYNGIPLHWCIVCDTLRLHFLRGNVVVLRLVFVWIMSEVCGTRWKEGRRRGVCWNNYGFYWTVVNEWKLQSDWSGRVLVPSIMKHGGARRYSLGWIGFIIAINQSRTTKLVVGDWMRLSFNFLFHTHTQIHTLSIIRHAMRRFIPGK